MLVSSVCGAYLIIWTETHIEQASYNCDRVLECHDDLTDDAMMTWKYGACYKGKVYPFVPMDNYTSPIGDKLYCDCKYALIAEYSSEKSSIGFVNRMRSLRWLI